MKKTLLITTASLLLLQSCFSTASSTASQSSSAAEISSIALSSSPSSSSILLSSSAHGSCSETAESSSSVESGSIWDTVYVTDFSESGISDNPDWSISTWSNDNRTHSADNLWIEGDSVLVLKVNGGTAAGEQSTGAEIVHNKHDFLYGSYRYVAKLPTESGSISGMFYYKNDKSEIDIEYLSKDPAKIYFTIHENIGFETHRALFLGFDPSADYHEYRFDWFADRVEYWVDSKLLTTLTTNVPKVPGNILLNHWTLGNANWGGGPPINDALLYVKRMEFHTNF